MMGQTITSHGLHFNKYKIDVNFFFQNLFTCSAENFTKTMFLKWLIQMNAPAKAYRLLIAHIFLNLT